HESAGAQHVVEIFQPRVNVRHIQVIEDAQAIDHIEFAVLSAGERADIFLEEADTAQPVALGAVDAMLHADVAAIDADDLGALRAGLDRINAVAAAQIKDAQLG